MGLGTEYDALGIQFFLPVDLLTISLEQKIKISNYNLDLREVPQSFLTELLPTLPFCLTEIHYLPYWSSSEL